MKISARGTIMTFFDGGAKSAWALTVFVRRVFTPPNGKRVEMEV